MTPRDRIIRATVELLEAGGRGAVSTRAVSQAAGVQVPTIYRQFGDMEGLLAAAASHRFADYAAGKRSRAPTSDPVEDLRQGWDFHVGFGLAHPAVYSLMYGDPVREVAAVAESEAHLRALVRRVAEAGRLRVGVELAARIIHAGGMGVTMSLMGMPPEARDPAVSELMREAVLAAITTAATDEATATGPQLATRAVSLKAVLGGAAGTLTPAETSLLAEWLDRLAAP